MSLKRNQILNLILFIYIVITIAILYLDLGETKLGLTFTSLVANLVPSIIPTADITLTPGSSALVLALSWVMIVLGTLIMVLIANWKSIDYEDTYNKTPWWIMLGVCIGTPLLMFSMAYYAPTNSGMSNNFLWSNLKEYKPFIILYGSGLWLSISAGWFSVIFISICTYRKYWHKQAQHRRIRQD